MELDKLNATLKQIEAERKAEEDMKELKAARMFQKRWRGVLGRRKAAEEQAAAMKEIEDYAATQLQKMSRGRMARVRAQRLALERAILEEEAKAREEGIVTDMLQLRNWKAVRHQFVRPVASANMPACFRLRVIILIETIAPICRKKAFGILGVPIRCRALSHTIIN